VLEDVSRDVPDASDLGGECVPLRWKLLLALPVINVVTGVVVAGLSAAPDGAQTLDDLGWDCARGARGGVHAVVRADAPARPVGHRPDRRASPGDCARRAGDLSARAPVLSTDEAGALAGRFNQMLSCLQERERLCEAFGAFVAPQVVERVLEEGTMLEGEEVEVSVLFLDIRGFTALAEHSTAR